MKLEQLRVLAARGRGGAGPGQGTLPAGDVNIGLWVLWVPRRLMLLGGRARRPEELPVGGGSFLFKFGRICNIVVKGCGIETEKILY